MTDFWSYSRCKVIRVIDGDTLEMDLDMGLRIHAVPISVRILNLWCDESGTPTGDAAYAYALGLIAVAPSISVTSHKWEWSFNRIIGTVWLGNQNYAELMIAAGHGRATR